MAEEESKKDMWLTLAENAFTQAISFVDTNYRKQWEKNERYFNSKHHKGSKYLKDSYKYRSKLFRPKTRSALRSNEASAAAAFFSNQDVISVEPDDPNHMIHVIAAEFQEALLQLRLTKTIPWFMICLGAFQDAQKYGVIVSYQDWKFKEKTIKYQILQRYSDGMPMVDDKGKKIYSDHEETTPVKDEPYIEIIPIENLLIHPASSWLDPVNSSPYVIQLIPMYIQDVKAKMSKNENDKTGKTPWKTIEDGELSAATKHRFDSTRLEREDGRTDKFDTSGSGELSSFDIVWVHRNFMRFKDEEIVYYTLGTQHMLTDPVLIEDEYPWLKNGERPIVMGTAVIETHKIYTSGVGQLGEGIQKEILENVNQRLDNVKFVLNKRWFVRRGSQTDIKSITRNVPGGVTLTNEPDKDIVAHEFNDVTSSAYAEQDRLNLDFDEATGAFSASSIQSNRKMNETVGGMNMLRGETNALKEYLIRTFSETWVEKVLKQVLMLEREYESDEVLMRLAANKSKALQKIGIQLSPEGLLKLLEFEFSTTINVGIGATDPVMKVNNFMLGMRAIGEVIRTDTKGKFKIDEVAKEIFGRIGYKDGARFVNTDEDQDQDPEKMQLAQMIQQLQQKLESKMDEIQSKILIQQMKEEGDTKREILGIKGDLALEHVKNQGDRVH